MSPSQPINGESRKPAPRRKPKPKFEVPPEVASAPTAWVYRADAPPVASAVRVPAATSDGSARPVRPVEGIPDPTTIMLAAIETMAASVAAANRMFLIAASLMGAPIEVTRKILGL